jgi:hypothetical protein
MPLHGRGFVGASLHGPAVHLTEARRRLSLPARLALGVLVSLAFMLGAQSALKVAPAAADPLITISLTNAPSYCVNRQGGSNSSGATVFVFACSGGNDTWYEQDVSPDTDYNCNFNTCLQFMDPGNLSVCLALGNNESGTLVGCGSQEAHWQYENPHILRNSFWGADLITNNDADRAPLGGDPQPVDWHQWTGP